MNMGTFAYLMLITPFRYELEPVLVDEAVQVENTTCGDMDTHAGVW